MTSFGSRRSRASLTAALVFTALGLLTPIFSTGVRTQTGGRQFYVAPNGSSTNDGSQARPLDLATALGSASPARPGDTIWLRGGTYIGNFTSHLTGSASAPIVVRQYPGERATIDANTPNRTAPALVVSGADAWYWGFEVTDSNTQRVNTQRANSVDVYGARTKFINLVVHDGLQGFGLWTPAVDAEIYGSLIYNVGTEATDRGHGHSIYTQNQTGIKQIVDSILFNSFSFGIHAYTEGGSIDNFRFEGNVLFNHGLLSASGAKANILLGGRRVAHDAVIVDNYSYYSPGVGGRGLDLGYITPCERPTVQNNYAAGGTPFNLNCTNAVVNGNTFYGGIPSSLPAAHPNNTFHTTRPTGVAVDVRPNRYEPGRGHVIIYNWAGLASVDVDLSPLGLGVGDGFEIRDAQNFFGPAVFSGTYSGATVDIPMTGLTAAPPIGNAPRRPPHTAPEFGVFVVLRANVVQNVPPSVSFTSSPTSATAPATIGLTATASDTDGTIGQVGFYSGATLLGTDTTSPYSYSWSNVPAGTYTLTARATDNRGATTTSTPVTVTVAAPSGGGGGGGGGGGTTAATFVRTDAATQGSWRGVYGTEGYSLAPDLKALPGYAQVTMAGNLGWVWSNETTDGRGLQRPTGTGRFAATWYNQNSFNVDVTISDGQSHRVALYVVDWDTQNRRAQTIEVVDAATNAVLDRRSAASFRGGQYWVWQVSGRVRFRLIKTAWDSVVSGIFFDTAGGSGGNVAPTVSLTSSPTSATAPATMGLTATAADSDGTIGQVGFYSGATLLGTDTTSPYSYSWSNVPAGTYTLTARATDNRGATTTSTPVTVTVTAPSGGGGGGGGGGGTTAAAFVRTDTATKGSWRGVYGTEGYSLAPDLKALPGYAQVTMTGNLGWVWSNDTTDVRGLQRPTGTGRFAATWYNQSSFTVDVTISDGQSHHVALYVVDWDTANRRVQTIEVLDASTNAVLDRRSVANFGGGQYWVWQVSGRVRFRLIKTAWDSVVSGVFFDR